MYGGPKAPTKADIAALGNVGGFSTPYATVADTSSVSGAVNTTDKAGADKGGAPGADKYAPTYPGSTGMRPGGGLGLTAIPGLTTTATGTMAELQAMRDQMGPAQVDPSVQAQIDKYIADCQAVKAKYPKPAGF